MTIHFIDEMIIPVQLQLDILEIAFSVKLIKTSYPKILDDSSHNIQQNY